MTIKDLPEQYKRYTLSLSDRSKYSVNGLEKVGIMEAGGNFIELKNGSIINKAHIVAIHFEGKETAEAFKLLSDEERASVKSSITKNVQ